jgi:hypothetical protein
MRVPTLIDAALLPDLLDFRDGPRDSSGPLPCCCRVVEGNSRAFTAFVADRGETAL